MRHKLPERLESVKLSAILSLPLSENTIKKIETIEKKLRKKPFPWQHLASLFRLRPKGNFGGLPPRSILNTGDRTMTYNEAIDAVITKKEAIEEIRKHGIDPKEFFQDMGEKEEYIGGDVLNWLGY